MNEECVPTGFSGQSNPQPTLKPCPFCGHKIEGRQPYWTPMETDDDYYAIKCGYCGALMVDEDYDTVIILWNRRAKE